MPVKIASEPKMFRAAFACLSVLLPAAAMAALDDVEVRETRYTGGEYENEPFKYLLLKPKHVEPGKKYPLVLFLHGAGERGTDPRVIEKHFFSAIASDENMAKFPCFVVAPQCRPGKKWADNPWGVKESAPITPEPTDQMRMALQIVDETLKEFPIDTSRLYLTGLSMGGYGSWDLAVRQPDRWAAVVPICGGGDETLAAKLVGVPVWAVHGDADPAVPVERSRRMIAAIKAAGGDPKYTEYAGVGHDSWTRAYADPDGVLPWMFAQRKKAAE